MEPWDEDAQEFRRDYTVARVRNALACKDLSTLPEELRDVRKLADLTMLYSREAVPDAPFLDSRSGALPNKYKAPDMAVASPARCTRNRYYLLPPLITQNVKAAKIGAEDSPGYWD